MRKFKYEFLIIAGLILTMGVGTAFADKDKKKKAPKNMGTISVKTSEASYPVKIDGQYVGMSGVTDGAEFYVDPNVPHTVEVEGPAGTKSWTTTRTVRKGGKECICLKSVTTPIYKDCPYNIRLEGPESVMEGDIITFSAFNSYAGTPVPLNYKWSLSAGKIVSGLGTSVITVDTTGMGNSTINADLDVNDDVYSAQCRQVISVPTRVTPLPTPPPIGPVLCDEVVSKAPDDDKARLDNCMVQVQNAPDAQLYIIIYQGNDRVSQTRNSYDNLSKRAMQYLVNVRGIDPRRVTIVRGPDRDKTTYEMYIVPPGAQPPVPR